MGSISNTLENEILDHVLKVGSFAVPADIYIALSTADPLDDASGIAEPVGGDYARVVCNTWDAAISRATQNGITITYPEASAGWGTITHFAIFDAISGGNFLGHGTFGSSRTISIGQTFSIYIGEIDVSFNTGGASNYLANKLLDHIFKVDSFTVPANIYIALTTAAITDAMSGSSISEPPANYARILHNSWNTAAAGISTNNGEINFVKATTEWGNVTHAALIDAITSGNMLIYLTLTTAQNLIIGDTPKFTDTSFEITID